MSKVVIIDYGSGNLRSAEKAFSHVAKGDVLVTSNPAELKNASHIVLPGVGAFADCAAGLKAVNGMIAELEEQVLAKKKPFLGICVGMQLLAYIGLEHGEHKGLGWIGGKVERIIPAGNLPVPHMGWNEVNFTQNSSLFNGISGELYFVHSYHFVCDKKYILATADYGGKVTAAIAKENIFGVQFHPEKSQQNGLKLLKNFLEI